MRFKFKKELCHFLKKNLKKILYFPTNDIYVKLTDKILKKTMDYHVLVTEQEVICYKKKCLL